MSERFFEQACDCVCLTETGRCVTAARGGFFLSLLSIRVLRGVSNYEVLWVTWYQALGVNPQLPKREWHCLAVAIDGKETR